MERRCLSPWKGAVAGGLIAFGFLLWTAPRARADDAPTTISSQDNALSRAKSAAALTPAMPSGPPGSSTAAVRTDGAPAAAARPAAAPMPAATPAPAPPVAIIAYQGRPGDAAPKASAPSPEQAEAPRRKNWGLILGVGAAIFALGLAIRRR